MFSGPFRSALVVLLLLAPPCAAGEWRGTVVAVSDGDTVVVRCDGGRVERVRYLYIDTPELHHPRRREEELGPEAREANRDLVEGQEVRLITDAVPRDRYGRLLARVVLDTPQGPVDVGAELVRRGLALPLFIPPNDGGRKDIHRALEEARREGRGWWGRARGRAFSCAQLWGEFSLVAGNFCVLTLRVDEVEERPTRWILRERGSRLSVTLPRDFSPSPRDLLGHTLRAWGKAVPSFSGGEMPVADPLQIEVVDNAPPFPEFFPEVGP